MKTYISQKDYYEGVIQDKTREFQELLNYQKEQGCLMAYVTNLLNDPFTRRCGKCSNCMQQWTITEDNVTDAQKSHVQQFLATQFILIEPRKKSALTYKNLSFVHTPGIALSYYHEELGKEASRGKYQTGVFSEILVQASANKLRKYMNKLNVRGNIVIIPILSNRRPQLVSQFANRLAKHLQLQYVDVLGKRENEPEQKTALNSQFQEKNIRDYLFVKDYRNLNNVTIILVDDFVDSKWTFTIAAELLGTTYQNVTVIPFAISDTSGSD